MKDYENLAKDLKYFARRGDASAIGELGALYYEGKGVSKNRKKAVSLLEEASYYGDSVALNNLGECYFYGEVVKKDVSKAFELFTQSARAGDANGQYNLGYCYEMGLGVEKDGYESARWYRRSAEQGNSEAQFRLGLYYEKLDEYKALYWFRKASSQGQHEAKRGVKRVERKLNRRKAEYYRTKDIKGKFLGDLNLGARLTLSILFSVFAIGLVALIPLFATFNLFDLFANWIEPIFALGLVDAILKGALMLVAVVIPIVAIATFFNFIFARWQNRLCANVLCLTYGLLNTAGLVFTIMLMLGFNWISVSFGNLCITLAFQVLLLPSILMADYRILLMICSCKLGRIILSPINFILLPIHRLVDKRIKDYSFRFIYYPVNSSVEYGAQEGRERVLLETSNVTDFENTLDGELDSENLSQIAEKQEFTVCKDSEFTYEYCDYAQNGEVTYENGEKLSKLSFKKYDYFCKVAFEPRSQKNYKE